MSLFNRIRLTAIIILAFVVAVSAQSGWKVNRTTGAGDLFTVYFTSADKGWIAGDGGYLAWTADGGRNWTQQKIGTSESVNEIFFRNDDNGYIVAGQKMFRTRDGGRNWQEIKITKGAEFKNQRADFLSVKFADKKRGIVIGSVLNAEDRVVDSLIMRTEDGGETWQRVYVTPKVELYHLDFSGSSLCWIVGSDGLVLVSYNGGLSFQPQRSGVTTDLYNVDFRDDKEGYAVGAKGTILRTEDGGETWEKVAAGISTSLMRVDFADDKNGVVVGYDGAILRSSDRGKTWARQQTDTSKKLYGLYFTKKYGWAVGADGVVVQSVR